MNNYSGFLIIDKEAGLTSQSVDILIKKKFNIRKVGHLGTLDPFATGLLIIGLLEGTKFLPLFKDEKKTYVATLSLGKETDSLDLTGNIVSEKEVPALTEEKIKDVLSSFIGKQKQQVPTYSAKHINGERSYVLLRKGIDFIPPTVDIEVKEMKLLSFTSNIITFETTVSKGTYIRSLGRDIAYRLNTVGHLTSLRRTKVDDIDLSHAKRVDKISDSDIITIPSMFNDIPVIEGNEAIAKRAIAGNDIYYKSEKEHLFFAKDNELIALYKKDREGHYICQRGIRHD